MGFAGRGAGGSRPRPLRVEPTPAECPASCPPSLQRAGPSDRGGRQARGRQGRGAVHAIPFACPVGLDHLDRPLDELDCARHQRVGDVQADVPEQQQQWKARVPHRASIVPASSLYPPAVCLCVRRTHPRLGHDGDGNGRRSRHRLHCARRSPVVIDRPDRTRRRAGSVVLARDARTSAINDDGEETLPMTCRDAIDIIADFLDQVLASDAVEALEAHLRDCAPCRAYLNTYRKTRGLVRGGGPCRDARRAEIAPAALPARAARVAPPDASSAAASIRRSG